MPPCSCCTTHTFRRWLRKANFLFQPMHPALNVRTLVQRATPVRIRVYLRSHLGVQRPPRGPSSPSSVFNDQYIHRAHNSILCQLACPTQVLKRTLHNPVHTAPANNQLSCAQTLPSPECIYTRNIRGSLHFGHCLRLLSGQQCQ
jgi:hypothetical protein